MTNLSVAIPSNTSPMDWYAEHGASVLKGDDIATLCGVFSGQAKTAAIIGLILAITAFFYFGKYRERIVAYLGDAIVWTDRLLLMSIAFSFAVIITRLYYGG